MRPTFTLFSHWGASRRLTVNACHETTSVAEAIGGSDVTRRCWLGASRGRLPIWQESWRVRTRFLAVRIVFGIVCRKPGDRNMGRKPVAPPSPLSLHPSSPLFCVLCVFSRLTGSLAATERKERKRLRNSCFPRSISRLHLLTIHFPLLTTHFFRLSIPQFTNVCNGWKEFANDFELKPYGQRACDDGFCLRRSPCFNPANGSVSP